MLNRPAFNPDKFRQLLPRNNFRFQFFPEIDSTNLEAKRYLRANLPEELVLVADLQTSGKGRQGRIWQAPPASGLLCTLAFPLELPLEKAFLYTASLGLAVIEAAQQLTSTQLQLKWPNDLLRGGRKVGGILAELEQINGKYWLVLGFGLNISIAEADFASAGIADKAANLTPPVQPPTPREEFLAAILQNFAKYRQRLPTQASSIQQAWSAALVTLGQRVQVWRDEQVFLEGKALWVDEDGALVVQDDGGQQQRIQAGDVSVRLPDGRYSA